MESDPAQRLAHLNRLVTECSDCPRLRTWCLQVAAERKRAYRDQLYWGLPVPHFGDPEALGLVLGLAPAAHGANRTGRMFTGDRSGDWLYRAMHRAGLANQPESISISDGLQLTGVLITASVHCAPPENKPTREEVAACRRHLEPIAGLRPWRAVLCLGSLAWEEALRVWPIRPRPKFGHGVEAAPEAGPRLMASYHPSQQNTFTGKLTEAMLDEVMARFAAEIRREPGL